MINLHRAFETDNGIIVGQTVIPDSVLETTRSYLPAYTDDLLTRVDFYNSLTQVDANRIASSVFVYDTDEKVSSQTNTYYENDGVTVFQTENIAYFYDGDDLIRTEVT